MSVSRVTQIGVALAAASLVLSGCRGSADAGATASPGISEEACPKAVNKDHGCIYLGTISDLTGPYAALGTPFVEAQAAFWQRVNEQGGIGDYDVDVSKYVRDAKFNPETHNQMYQEIRGDVLALAQTLGASQTVSILQDMKADDMIGTPATFTSAWEFEDNVMESGASYCFAAMNGVDWLVENRGAARKVVSVGLPGDYGGDIAVGAEAAAKANGMEFKKIETSVGQDNQAGAIAAILKDKPDVVVVGTGPSELAAIVAGTTSQGYEGSFVGSALTWNPALLKSPAAAALKSQYVQSASWGPWATDSAGHKAMREALGDVTPSEFYTSGWVWSYPLLAALKKAAADGDLNRENLVKAAGDLTEVDYEGMLPAGAGATAGEPQEVADRHNLINEVDETAPTGISVLQDFFEGPTVKAYDFSEPCFSL